MRKNTAAHLPVGRLDHVGTDEDATQALDPLRSINPIPPMSAARL